MLPRAGAGRLHAAALERLLASPEYEVLPLAGTVEHAAFLPGGATVAVTTSPARGQDATVRTCIQLQHAGFTVVANIAARMIHGAGELRRIVSALRAGGVDRAFIIGGDTRRNGGFADGLDLLRALRDIGHHFREIGIPCYPQGHPHIPAETLTADLAAKEPFADYMTSQLCFDARALDGWLRERRHDGLTLPLHIGVAGAVDIARLLRLGTKIGVRDAGRFATGQKGLLARMLWPGKYRPDRLLEALAPAIADPELAIRRLHLYTFNAVRATEAWRLGYLRRLARTRPAG